MKPEFKEEHKVKLACLESGTSCCSPYFSDEEAGLSIIRPEMYNLVDLNNDSLADGTYLFVMDIKEDAVIYYAVNINAGRNHSCFTRGESVFFAGQFIVKDGAVQTASNESGHYKPTHEESINPLARLVYDLELESLTFTDHSAVNETDLIDTYILESNDDLNEITFQDKDQIVLSHQSLSIQGYSKATFGAPQQLVSRVQGKSSFFVDNKNLNKKQDNLLNSNIELNI